MATLIYVTSEGERQLEARYRDNLARELRAILEEHPRLREKKQLGAAKELGISQGQLSQILQGSRGRRGAGLPALVKIRNFTGRTIDDLLGLAPFAPAADADESIIERRLVLIERELADIRGRTAESRTPVGRRKTTG